MIICFPKEQTKVEGVTEWHLPKTDESIVWPAGDSLRHIEMKRNENVDFRPDHSGLPQQ